MEMDIEEIRGIIQRSIREQVKKLVDERSRPPSSFESFNFLVREALSEVTDKPSHEAIYDMWRSISSEVAGIQDAREMVTEWNSSLEYYVSTLDAPRKTKSILFNCLKRRP